MESKTIFKIGMKVYDSIFFSNHEGGVSNILEKENINFHIQVTFRRKEGNNATIVYYTYDGKYTTGGIQTLSTSPYTLQGFKQEAPIPTFEEAEKWFVENNKFIYKSETIDLYPSKEYFRAFEALKKLIILRDYYNQGWIPDWNDFKRKKFCIVKNQYLNSLIIDTFLTVKKVLYFESKDIAKTFVKEQEKLLNQALILL